MPEPDEPRALELLPKKGKNMLVVDQYQACSQNSEEDDYGKSYETEEEKLQCFRLNQRPRRL